MTFVLLTGATRGIGRAAAIALAGQGVELALVGREHERVRDVAREARAAGGGAPVHEHVADLVADARRARACGGGARAHEHIDVLANNAGAMFASRKETAEGLERTFALNHLAPFLLTNLLRDRLDGGRVVTTASDAHKAGRLDLDDLQSRSPTRRCACTARASCATSSSRASSPGAPRSCTPTAFTPASYGRASARTKTGSGGCSRRSAGPFLRSPERGARSLVWLALSQEAAPLDGEYVQDEKVLAPSAQAQDDVLAAGLWERSAQLVGMPTEAPA